MTDDELRTLRSRVESLAAEVDRLVGDRPDVQRRMLGRVFDDGNGIPTEVPKYFAVHPSEPSGEEVAGGAGTIEVASSTCYFLVIGPGVPEADDYLIAHSINSRWVADYGLAEETPISGCGVVTYALRSACPTVVAHTPSLSAVTLLEGSDTEGIDEVQGITFGVPFTTSGVTGGSFAITFNGQTTARILWSSTPATLVSRIQAALDALPNVEPGDILVADRNLDAFPNTALTAPPAAVTLSFGGAYAATELLPVTTSNFLAGLSSSITVSRLIRGREKRSEIQALYFGPSTITGGSFTLAYAGQTTGAITWSAVAATMVSNIQAALEALSNVGVGEVRVQAGVPGSYGAFGPPGPSGTPYFGTITITFEANPIFPGPLGEVDQPQITIASNSLTGTSRYDSIAGATVTLKKGGTTVSTGVTDAEGIVQLTIVENTGTYTLDVSGGGAADYFPISGLEIASPLCYNNPVNTLQMYPLMVPLEIIDSTLVASVTLTGISGSAAGFTVTIPLSDDGDGQGQGSAMVPGINVTGGVFQNSYTVQFAGSPPSAGAIIQGELGFGACGGVYVLIDGGNYAATPITFTATTTLGDDPTPADLSLQYPQPGVPITVVGGDPPSGVTDDAGQFQTVVPTPQPGEPDRDVDWTADLPPYTPTSGTVPIPATPTPTPVPVDVPVAIPSTDHFQYPKHSLDPLPTELPATLNSDPLFGDLGGTEVTLLPVTTCPAGWEGWFGYMGGTIGDGTARIKVAYDPCASVIEVPAPLPTVNFDHYDDPDPPHEDPPDETIDFPPVYGTPVGPIGFVAANPPDQTGPVITVGRVPCSAETATFPDTVNVTLGAAAALGSFAGQTFAIPRVYTPPVYYRKVVTDHSPFLDIAVSYTFIDGVPQASVRVDLYSASASMYHAEYGMDAIGGGTSICPIDFIAEENTVVEPAVAAPCPAGISLGWYFTDDLFTQSKYIHLRVYDPGGHEYFGETLPISGVTYEAQSITNILGVRDLYRYDVSSIPLTPGRRYMIRAFSSPIAGYPAGDGPRTFLGEGISYLSCTRLAVRGVGFDGPDVGVILDDLGNDSFEDWRFGFFGDHSYTNTLLEGTFLILKQAGVEVARATLDGQGFAYFDFVPVDGVAYTLEVLPVETSGYPDHVFDIQTVGDPDINLKGFDEAIILDKGIDYIVDGCGCGIDGATLTLERAAIGAPGTVLQTWIGTTDAAGYVHFNIQIVPGIYTATATSSPYVVGDDAVNEVSVFPDGTEDNFEFASSSVYEAYTRLTMDVERMPNPNPATPALEWDVRYCFGGAPPVCIDPMPDSLFITLGTEAFWEPGPSPPASFTYKGKTLEVARPSDPAGFFYGEVAHGYRERFAYFLPTGGGTPFIRTYPTTTVAGGTFSSMSLTLRIEWSNWGACAEPIGVVVAEFSGSGGFSSALTMTQDSGSSACGVAYTASRTSGVAGPATATVSE